MQVDESVLGHVKPCAKCGVMSEVVDSNSSKSGIRLPASETETQNFDEQMIKDAVASSADPGSVSVAARLLSIAIPVMGLMLGILLVNASRAPQFGHLLCYMAMAAGFQVILVWPIYTMADDTRANRRLLEQIAKNLTKPTV